MQSVSSRIWTRVVVSISFDDNHYTTARAAKDVILSLSLVYKLFLILVPVNSRFNFSSNWSWKFFLSNKDALNFE